MKKKLIVGLGNPGTQYQNTRHNVGFMVIDLLAKKFNLQPQKNKQAILFNTVINDSNVFFAQPLTFMNLSGTFVREFVKFNQIDYQDLVVVYDDLDLPIGKFKLKANGSCAGHNGLRNIIDCLQTQAIQRIKIGIQNTSYDRTKKIDYVLGKFSKQELETLQNVLPTVVDLIEQILNFSFSYTLNWYNNHEKV